MPKKFDPEVKVRAVRMVREQVRMVQEHLSTYGSATATAAAVST